MAFDVDPRWLGDAAWPNATWPVDASSGAEPPYDLHRPPVGPPIEPPITSVAFKDTLARLASGAALAFGS